jgi:hypothetical protein
MGDAKYNNTLWRNKVAPVFLLLLTGNPLALVE